MKKIVTVMSLMILAVPIIVLANPQSDYKAKCAICHGANGMVNTRKAKAMHVDIKKLALTASKKNKTEMIAIIEKGRDKMPAFENELTRDQITAIVDYIVALSRI